MSEPAERIAAIDAADLGLKMSRFTADDAWALGSHLRAVAAHRKAPVAILIRSSSGATLFAASLDGASADNSKWAARKVATALWFERCSMAIGLEFKLRGLTLADFALPAEDYTIAPGAFPLRVAGAGCVAAIAMSGLSGADDHELVMDAIGWLLQQQVE